MTEQFFYFTSASRQQSFISDTDAWHVNPEKGICLGCMTERFRGRTLTINQGESCWLVMSNGFKQWIGEGKYLIHIQQDKSLWIEKEPETTYRWEVVGHKS